MSGIVYFADCDVKPIFINFATIHDKEYIAHNISVEVVAHKQWKYDNIVVVKTFAVILSQRNQLIATANENQTI